MKFTQSILLIFLLSILCTSVKSSENEKVEGEIIEAPKICDAGETKMKECNRCRCSPSGRWLCTRKMCVPIAPASTMHITPIESNDIAIEAKSLIQMPPKFDECTPGQRFKKDCNWCFCTNTGIGICTLRGCGVERPRISLINDNAIRARRQATEEKVYTQEDLQSPDFKCTPSYSFKVECNTCWCSADGKRPRYCTRIACQSSANVYSTLPPPLPSQKTH